MPDTYGTRPLSWYAEQAPDELWPGENDEQGSCWTCGDYECQKVQAKSCNLKRTTCEDWRGE